LWKIYHHLFTTKPATPPAGPLGVSGKSIDHVRRDGVSETVRAVEAQQAEVIPGNVAV
jgi:hypothetical protein